MSFVREGETQTEIPMENVLQTELERLQEQRRALQERQKELETMCSSLDERIKAMRDEGKDSAGTGEAAKPG